MQGAAPAVGVFLAAEGIDGDGGRAARGGAAQHARAARVVEVPLLRVGAAVVPLDEVVEPVVGEGGAAAPDGAGGDVAPGIVHDGVVRPAFGTAGLSDEVEPGQLVRVRRIAVEIGVGAQAAERTLPELAQVREEELVVIGAAAQAVAQGSSAPGTVARGWLSAAVARPHHATLFIVTEVGGFARRGIVRTKGGRQVGDVAGGVITEILLEELATAAALPGCGGTDRAQVAIVDKLLVGQGRARAGLKEERVELRTRVIAQVSDDPAAITQPGLRTERGIVELLGDGAAGVGIARTGGGCVELVGSIVRLGQLVGRQGCGDIPTIRQVQEQLLGDGSPALVVLHFLRGGGSAPFGIGGGRHTLGQSSNGKIRHALRAELRHVVRVLQQGIGSAGASARRVDGRDGILHTAGAP